MQSYGVYKAMQIQSGAMGQWTHLDADSHESLCCQSLLPPDKAPTARSAPNNNLKKLEPRGCKRLHANAKSTKRSLNQEDHNHQQASPRRYFTLMENTDTTSLLLQSKHHFPLKHHFCEWDKEGFVCRAALLPKTIQCGSSTCLHTSWLV